VKNHAHDESASFTWQEGSSGVLAQIQPLKPSPKPQELKISSNGEEKGEGE
jgi:hypothetical protein